MQLRRLVLGGVVALASIASSAHAEFKRGHIYVSAADNDWCTVKGGPAAIVEIDPATGEMTVFAHSDDHPFCSPGPIRFTPDGSRLLYSEAVFGRVLAFDGDGNSEIMMPVFLPWGMAFDAGDNLYISSGSTVKRYPADGGPLTVFADNNDGLFDVGDLAFAPNGDLFYAGHETKNIVRITPDGVGFPFDNPFGQLRALVFDRWGNLYVSLDLPGCVRYEGGNADAAMELIPPGLASIRAFGLSPDHRILYGGNWTGRVYAIDPQLGGLVTVANIRDLPIWSQTFVSGLAVFAPIIPGDLNGDGDVGIADFSLFIGCVTGPGVVTVNVWCRPADIDNDDDVDWADFGGLQILIQSNDR